MAIRRRQHEKCLEIYFREIRKLRRLTSREEKELGRRMRDGDPEARETFIKHNLRLAAFIAKRYAGWGVLMSDLVQAANVGLVQATKHFDPDKGPWIRYATQYIIQALNQELADTLGATHLPEESLHMALKIRRYEDINEIPKLLEKHLGRKPSQSELERAERALDTIRSFTLDGVDRIIEAPYGGDAPSRLDRMYERRVLVKAGKGKYREQSVVSTDPGARERDLQMRMRLSNAILMLSKECPAVQPAYLWMRYGLCSPSYPHQGEKPHIKMNKIAFAFMRDVVHVHKKIQPAEEALTYYLLENDPELLEWSSMTTARPRRSSQA